MLRVKSISLLFLIIINVPIISNADPKTLIRYPESKNIGEQDTPNPTSQNLTSQTPTIPLNDSSFVDKQSVKNFTSEYFGYYTDYYKSRLKEIDRVNLRLYEDAFEWQSCSGRILFWVVILITLCGICLSVAHHIAAKNLRKTKLPTDALQQPPQQPLTGQLESSGVQIEISKDKLIFRTEIVGLAILFTSLAFLFLYLNFVYGIKIVDSSTERNQTRPPIQSGKEAGEKPPTRSDSGKPPSGDTTKK